MELGVSLKYFFNKAKIVINYNNLFEIDLLSYFPLLKSGYGTRNTIKNVLNLYIKINELNVNYGKIKSDNLFNESFNGEMPVLNCDLYGNKYFRMIKSFESFLEGYGCPVSSLILMDPEKCSEPLKLRYSNITKTMDEFNLSEEQTRDLLKKIFIKNYVKYDNTFNTFDLLKYRDKIFDPEFLSRDDIIDIINFNTSWSSHQENYEFSQENLLSDELIYLLGLMEQENVLESAKIRPNKTKVNLFYPKYNDLSIFLKLSKEKNRTILKPIFNTNYLKLLYAVLSNTNVYKYLYDLKLDPRGYSNHLYHISNNQHVKKMIAAVTIEKIWLQKIVLTQEINKIIKDTNISEIIHYYINTNLL